MAVAEDSHLHAGSILVSLLPDAIHLLVKLQIFAIQLGNQLGIGLAVPVHAILADKCQIVPATQKGHKTA